MRRALQVVSLLLASFVAGFAQQTTECPAQHLIVNVTDADDVLVPGLQPNDFRVLLHGHPVNVVSATIEKPPIRVVILLDTSGSMGDRAGKFDLARRFAGELIRSLTPESQVALVTFADEVKVVAGLSRDRSPAVQALIALDPNSSKPPLGGRTAFYDALLAASSIFGHSQAGDSIYAITDGGDNHSRAHFEDVKRTLIERSIRLFCAMIEASVARTPEEQQAPEMLADLVHDTGGLGVVVQNGAVSLVGDADYAFNQVPKAKRVQAEMGHLYRRLQEFYMLETEGAKLEKKPQSLKLSILDERGKPRKHLIVTYPAEILPCSH